MHKIVHCHRTRTGSFCASHSDSHERCSEEVEYNAFAHFFYAPATVSNAGLHAEILKVERFALRFFSFVKNIDESVGMYICSVKSCKSFVLNIYCFSIS